MTAPRIPTRAIEAALTELVGRPFEAGARGPAAFDCWGLVLELRRRLALPLPPDFASGALTRGEILALFAAARPSGWAPGELAPGAIVLARSGGHAGIFLAGRIVHAHRRVGVAAWALGYWRAVLGELEAWEVARCG